MSSHPVERQARRGVILLSAAGLMFVLLAFIGLAFDVGYLQWQRRRAQSAADGGAMAGAWAKLNGQAIVAKGQQGSALNGFTDGANGVTVTINNPPTLGAYAGDANYVEAIVSQDAPSFFMRVLNWNTLPVRARGVATIHGVDQACVIALDPSGSSTLKVTGNPDLTFGCGVLAESTADPAAKLSGSSTITMTSGATIGSVGTTVTGGNITANSVASHLNNPGDPLAGLVMPTPPTPPPNCYQGSSLGMAAGPCGDHNNDLPSGGVYSPGVYCGGISINGGSSATFSPGLYIIAGRPGLTFNTTGTITGTGGVTFYVTDVAGWPCTGLNGANARIGSVSITSQTTVTMNAPTTGTYAGIFIFENRGLSNVPASSINGGSNSVMNGVIYLPSTDLTYAGGSSTSADYMMVIANTVTFTGNTTMSVLKLPTEFANNFPAFANWVRMAE